MLLGSAWWYGWLVLWIWGRSSVVEHLLCKQGAVGSIPTVSKSFIWLVECPLGHSWLDGVPLHNRLSPGEGS